MGCTLIPQITITSPPFFYFFKPEITMNPLTFLTIKGQKEEWGRDRELNPGRGIHSPIGYHYPTPAIVLWGMVMGKCRLYIILS